MRAHIDEAQQLKEIYELLPNDPSACTDEPEQVTRLHSLA